MMGLSEGQNGPDAARRRALTMFYIVTLAQIILASLLLLGATIIFAALCKLIWRAWSFGWTLWL